MNAPAAVQASPLYLVDASLYVFRAWHSMPNEFHDRDGWPTNAVHGFARFLLELLKRSTPASATPSTPPTRPTAMQRRTNCGASSRTARPCAKPSG
jgi:5'-3' exonuclease